MSTYQDLLKQKQALLEQANQIEQAIREKQQGDRAEALSKIKAIMAENGITAKDLGMGRGKTLQGAIGTQQPGKVPPKFRNPATGETWSGRGLQPRWLASALATGKTLKDFSL